MVPLKNVFELYSDGVNEGLFYWTIKPHGLKAGDFIRIEVVEGPHNYNTRKTPVTEVLSEHLFKTNHTQYVGDAHGVWSLIENSAKIMLMSVLAATAGVFAWVKVKK